MDGFDIILSKEVVTTSFLFLIFSCAASFVFAPWFIRALKSLRITRRTEYDSSMGIVHRQAKAGTPTMGGALVVAVIIGITILFNWVQRFTYVPIGVLGISALLGGADDLLNIFGKRRRVRSVAQTLRLMRVHRHARMRLWYMFTLPWTAFKRFFYVLGSEPGKGIQPHEKIIFQFIAGAVTAWWIYFKLGPEWRTIWVPFNGELHLGAWILPLIVFIVMFTANAVNVADGLDGLSGGTLITAFSALLLLSWIQGIPEFAFLNATVIGALLAYTYFNVRPAQFQMGDIGSLGLGALLAVMVIAQNRILILPLLGFVFFIELASVIVQAFARRILGRRVFKMSPLHHHFEILGWPEEKIVMRFWIINVIAVFVGVWMALY